MAGTVNILSLTFEPVYSVCLVSDIIRTLIGVGIALFGCVGIMEGDYLFATSIILFGLSLIPYWYKKASNKFIAIILPVLFVLMGFVVLLFTV